MPPSLRRLLAAFPLIVAIAGFALVVQAFVFATASQEAALAAAFEPAQRLDGRSRAEVLWRPDSLVVEPGVGKRAATLAVRMVGKQYVWGGASPASGFDCSGLIHWAYSQLGVDLPHNSHALFGVGREVSSARLETGDVLFFSGLGHVGLYLGGGRMVHAPYSGTNVEITQLTGSHYGRRLVGARRMV